MAEPDPYLPGFAPHELPPELAEPRPEPSWPPSAEPAPAPPAVTVRPGRRSEPDPWGWPRPTFASTYRRCVGCGLGIERPAIECPVCEAERQGIRVHAAPTPAEVRLRGSIAPRVELPPIPPDRRAPRRRQLVEAGR